uniref:Putative secretory peptide-53 n=1 Tax=Pleurobrachia bachei TaxID=34499 RepID=M4H1R9_PLEBA|nr:putative secretory peptide-53 [Pleurobrachia bachei]|eukprot:sb/3470533/
MAALQRSPLILILLTFTSCAAQLSSDWQSVEREVIIPWDLENTPVLIQSDSVAGSGEEIVIWTKNLKDGQEQGGGFKVKYGSTFQFQIHGCTAYKDLPVQPPTTSTARVWEISKTSTALKMSCDGLQVLDYEFKDSVIAGCSGVWEGNTVVSLKLFNSLDTATDYYRARISPSGKYFDTYSLLSLSFSHWHPWNWKLSQLKVA